MSFQQTCFGRAISQHTFRSSFQVKSRLFQQSLTMKYSEQASAGRHAITVAYSPHYYPNQMPTFGTNDCAAVSPLVLQFSFGLPRWSPLLGLNPTLPLRHQASHYQRNSTSLNYGWKGPNAWQPSRMENQRHLSHYHARYSHWHQLQMSDACSHYCADDADYLCRNLLAHYCLPIHMISRLPLAIKTMASLATIPPLSVNYYYRFFDDP